MIKYSDCRFCHGRGCIGCEGELRKAERHKTERIKNYQPVSEISDTEMAIIKAFANPCRDMSEESLSKENVLRIMNTPTPLMTIKLDNPEDMALAKTLIGGEAFGKMLDGKTSEEFPEVFCENAERYRIAQGMRNG